MQNLDFVECHSHDKIIKDYANQVVALLKDKHLTRNYQERKIKILQKLISSRISFLKEKEERQKLLLKTKLEEKKNKGLGDPKQIAAIRKTFRSNL